MKNLWIRFIIWNIHMMYLKEAKNKGLPIFYINGTGRDYPRYLIYTDNERIRAKLKDI